MSQKQAVVTGSFGYTGAAITSALQSRDWNVRTLTRRQAPEGEKIPTSPLLFEREHLVKFLRSTDVFVNTFWIRLPLMGESFEGAVEKSKLLLSSAKEAGVKRIVHISVSNAAQGRNLGYYRGKHEIELFLKGLGISYGIIRPTLAVGPGDVLTNNIAWFLRRFPIFLMPRGGAYRLQPVTLRDVGRITADAVEEKDNLEWDAAGPDIFTFKEYVQILQRVCGVQRLLLPAPNSLTLFPIRLLGSILRDDILVEEELLGLEQELLLSHAPGLGKESVSKWLMEHGKDFGKVYTNDIHRHFSGGARQAILSPNDFKT